MLDLDNADAAPVYQTMWLPFDLTAGCGKVDDYSCWIEEGTEYRNDSVKNFGYECVSNYCDFLYQVTVDTSVGAHVFKMNRNTGNHNNWNFYVDGDLFYTLINAPYTSAINVTVGLESYDMNVSVETFAMYNLQYKKGDGSFQDWAGEDWWEGTPPSTIQYPMCGQWHSPTSYWAGEYGTCS